MHACMFMFMNACSCMHVHFQVHAYVFTHVTSSASALVSLIKAGEANWKNKSKRQQLHFEVIHVAAAAACICRRHMVVISFSLWPLSLLLVCLLQLVPTHLCQPSMLLGAPLKTTTATTLPLAMEVSAPEPAPGMFCLPGPAGRL